jgi:hypothetical protein
MPLGKSLGNQRTHPNSARGKILAAIGLWVSACYGGTMATQAKVMDVYTIIEKQGMEKCFWIKVGACFTNRDGSFNVFLDALPVNGKLHIRPRTEKEEQGGEKNERKMV